MFAPPKSPTRQFPSTGDNLKPIRPHIRTVWHQTLLLVLCLSLTSSCTLLGVKQQVKEINAHGVIALELTGLSTAATNYALALTPLTKGTNVMVGFQVVGTDGLTAFLLRQNRSFDVGAFTDLNGNGRYDGGEPMALMRNIRPTSLADTSVRAKPILLRLSATNGLPRGQSLALPREDPQLGESLSVTLGEIADLNNPKFSSEAGELGMWKPFEFVQRYGFGIYFMEPYDPKRTPVLFVYGISGSPQDWRAILEKMDRRKHQLWFCQYPSGIRLDKAANGLSSAILLLKQRYGVKQIDVVAHSMGGLVSRGAIQRAVSLAGTNFIPHLVTISTPWGGHQAAELAVKHLDFPVPSWRDMAPGSDYLKEILNQPLPTGTRHDLLFSYKSSSSLSLPSENDGVVAVPSELLPQVQEQAASVLGVFQDHMGILASPITLQRVEQSLAR